MALSWVSYLAHIHLLPLWCALVEKYEEMKAYVKDTEKQRDQVGISYVHAYKRACTVQKTCICQCT